MTELHSDVAAARAAPTRGLVCDDKVLISCLLRVCTRCTHATPTPTSAAVNSFRLVDLLIREFSRADQSDCRDGVNRGSLPGNSHYAASIRCVATALQLTSARIRCSNCLKEKD